MRPGGDLRPTTRPSFPGSGDGIAGDRPSTLPARPDRPTIGGGDRPIHPDRPIIGGGGDYIHIGDNTINNITRPGWGLDRPGGDGWSQHHDWNNNWHDHWHDHCINPHYHDWYHGCWHGNWGNYWYRPTGAFFVGWGIGSWGYGSSYYNPYYADTAAAPYDYSQPIVVNNYASSEGDEGDGSPPPVAADTADNQQAMMLFDDGMAAFKAGQYQQSLSKFDGALKLMPGDAVLHEMRALALFALGQYQQAAAVLDSLLASAPGMDWTTMSQLYGDVNDYTTQLRALEAHCQAKPNDAAGAFVLAYHYIVMGHNDQAIDALRTVVKLQPKDATAQRMLKALAPEEAAPAATAPPTPDASEAPQTDLVGVWLAMAGDASVELTITDDSQFTWKATPKGQPAVELAGQIATTSDTLVLDSKSQGSMVGQVKSNGPDRFQFIMSGGEPGDTGLSFVRQHER